MTVTLITGTNFVILTMLMNENKSPNFHVQDVPIYGDTILAPMDGYSDWPFRSLCRELGSAMSYTEFVKVTFTFPVRFIFVS